MQALVLLLLGGIEAFQRRNPRGFEGLQTSFGSHSLQKPVGGAAEERGTTMQALATRDEIIELQTELVSLSSKVPHHIVFRKFKQIVKKGGEPDGAAFESVLRACQRAPSGPFALKVSQVLREMPPQDMLQGFFFVEDEGADLHPLTPLYGMAVEACARDAAPLDALRIMDLMREVSIPRIERNYVSVLRAAAQNRELDSESLAQIAGTAMRLLKVDGIRPGGDTYSMLLQTLLRAGRPEAALAAFEAMNDAQKSDMPPSNWGRAVLAASRCRNPEKVHELVEEAWGRGIRLSVPDMKAALRCLGQDGDGRFRSDVVSMRHWRIATRLLETIGDKASVDDYHFAITACGRAGKGQKALELFAELKALTGDEPAPRKTYNSCLHAALREEMMEETQQLLSEMQANKISFDVVTYNIMLDQYAQRGDWRGAIRTLQEMDDADDVSPNVVTFGTVIAAAARDKVSIVASELLSRMLARDTTPNTPCLMAALEACCVDPEEEDACASAIKVANLMIDAQIDVDEDRRPLISQLLVEALRRDDAVDNSDLIQRSLDFLGISANDAAERIRSAEL
eukprot:scaffold7381_cov310-Pinguiococcus_pyrenoidosus.AAC.90